MDDEMLITAIRRVAVDRLIDRKTLRILLRCPDEAVIESVLSLAAAELEAMRDPAMRPLAGGRGPAH